MDQLPRRDPYAEEIDRIREVVARHPLPDFVTGFDVRLGEFDGEPAMWIVFKTVDGRPAGIAAQRQRMADLRALREAVQPDLLDTFEDRLPYFRFELAEQAGFSKH